MFMPQLSNGRFGKQEQLRGPNAEAEAETTEMAPGRWWCLTLIARSPH